MDLFGFFKNFPRPWRGGVTSHCAMWLSGDRHTLVGADTRGALFVHSADCHAWPNALPVGAGASRGLGQGRWIDRARGLIPKIGRNPECVFVVDSPQTLLAINTSPQARDAMDLSFLMERSAHEVLPEMGPQANEYRWSVLTAALQPAAPDATGTFILAGIARDTAASIESWAMTQGISIIAILPATLGVLAWALHYVSHRGEHSTVFAAELENSSLQAIFTNGRVAYLETRAGRGGVPTLFQHLHQMQSSEEISIPSDTRYYVWDRISPHEFSGAIALGPQQIAEFARTRPLPPINSVPRAIETGEGHVLAWLANPTLA